MTGFFVHNSDSVWIENQGAALTRMIDAWNPDEMDSLLLLAPVASSLGYSGRGDFSVGDNGEVRPAAEGRNRALHLRGRVDQPSAPVRRLP